MILVTVGLQLGFDRLIEAMDDIAPHLPAKVVAQIGAGSLVPRNMEFHRRLEPGRFMELVERARVVVGHAGVGTVLTAEKYRKPLIVFPRSSDLGEHRNDHQRATANALAGRPGISVAEDREQLEAALRSGLKSELSLPQGSGQGISLMAAVALFVETGELAF
ncbi:MAG: glucuronosyltransferase [Erythrobacter sp. RIFCSPHIGHO2_12_FULL_63_10]|nr:MAG: glucuronosyltransferase [Erythrobacter sp. RIFCSPHIGHO2_12_FULL_63_10]